MRKRSITLGSVALVVLLACVALAGGTAKAARQGGFTAALISDIGKFTDKGFNQNQLAGLNQAKAKLGITSIALQSNSTSDYAPNFNQAIRKGAKLVVAAGYLLASTEATYAAKFPNVDFAITDDSVVGPGDFKGKETKNIEGLTYDSQQAGCLVGVLAAKEAQKMGSKVVGAVGGIKIPPVDAYIAGYKYCVAKAVPGTKVLVQYSNDFVATDKCATVAQNEIGQGAKVIFQVAGGCGLGALKAAASAGDWGIGVDVDQYADASHVLTSAIKRVDVGVFDAIQQAKAGKFKGGTNLVFSLKNNGVGVGKINPSVPKSWISLMNSYKAKIISGKLKVPAAF